MALSLIELIRLNKQKPIRRLWFKRRSATTGAYEADWVQVDDWKTIDRVVNWGKVSIEIDEEDRRIGAFNISGMTIQVKNDDGLFNSENDARSIWNGYLNRKLTKVKVECGYLDVDGETEVGVASIFEGVIDAVSIGDSQKASLRILSYQSILEKYDISDLSMSGAKTVDTVVDLIMNQAKIIQFIPFIASTADQNVTITLTENLEGTYWDILKDLAIKSNSVPLMIGSAWAFKARTIGATSVFDFKGHGVDVTNDIYRIKAYDDEGANKVRVHWKVEDSIIEAKSTDATLLLKYLGEPEIINLDEIGGPVDKQNIVNALLAEWGQAKPTIEFDTRFFLNQINPLDKITIEVRGQTIPQTAFVWNAWSWNDGSKWGKKIGSIIIAATTTWKVLKITKDIQTWKTSIKADVSS